MVVLVTFPWNTLQSHPHWMSVRWHPFDGRGRLLEVVLNIGFYVPGGALQAAAIGGSRRRRVAVAVGVATMLSAVTETAQLFSHGRVPSLVDVVANLAGAWLGAMAVSRRLR